ncbi:MAG TPA: hypothetical protein VG965_02135 [Patescibacteria group bacterium]|nr:hypothetical protein [Patescibacteria group bacterium]
MEKKVKIVNKNVGGGGAFYGMGFIGAIIYFMQHAASFSDVIIGIIKAIFWPALVVYKILEILKF